jgi:hypothetical protein
MLSASVGETSWARTGPAVTNAHAAEAIRICLLIVVSFAELICKRTSNHDRIVSIRLRALHFRAFSFIEPPSA